MSIKVKLLSCISLFILMLGVVILGVFAVGSQTITLDGNINFDVTDKSLWVKSVSISNDNYSEEPVDNFMPGYINENFNLAIPDQINTYGSITLHFEIINTTTTAYNVTTAYSGTVSGVTVTATPSQIPASSEEITEITSSTPSTQLDIIVANPNGDNINLSDITITFTEWQPQVYDFTFTTSGDTATLTSYTGAGGDVIIPSTFSIRVVDGQTQYIEGTDYTVTAIAAGTSSSGPFSSARSTLTSITIPETITSIGEYAFYDCTALTEINYNAIKANDLSLENAVFYNAGQGGTGITVNIGANVTKLPSCIFCPTIISYAHFPNITTVNFVESSVCETIGASAFWYCKGITAINIPESVTSIGIDAFYNCSITAITIPKGVTSISKTTFWGCTSLTTITISEGVMSIGSGAFGYCTSLTAITIPSSVTTIDDEAFYYCSSLTSITIPSSVISIGSSTFSGCNFNSVTIDSSYAYQNAGASSDTCGYLLQDANTVYVNANLVGSYTASSYLSSNFTCSENAENGYYVYTRN